MISSRFSGAPCPGRSHERGLRVARLGAVSALCSFVSAFGFAAARAADEPARAPLPVALVVTQLPRDTAAERQGPAAAGMLRARYGDGARLVRFEPDGNVHVLSEGFHSACDPDVSFDGKRILFAGKRAAADTWNVFELDLASGQARQVTRDLGQCRSPLYLSTFYTITETEPWDQIAFVSDHAGHADEVGGQPATSLYTAKPDGTFIQRITYNLSSDYDPTILADGRLIYASWHRATFDDGVRGRIALEWINVDGSDRAPFVAEGMRRIRHMPCPTTGGRVVFIESDAVPWDGAGTLGGVRMRRPLHTYEALSAAGDGLYHSPSPLPDGRVLVSRRPADGSGSHGVFRFDPESKAVEAVFDDPAFHEIQARAIVARSAPDGRSSVVSERDPTADLYCLGVYTNDLPDRAWLPPGTVKTLRVLEGLPNPAAAGGGSGLSPRRVLAEVPMPADGSFHIKVPANTPLQLQILDEQGIALRSCGWIWARSHQAQGCIGCHEDPERTPVNVVPSAIQDKPPELIELSEGLAATVDYRRDVDPIVRTKCLGCHAPGQSPPTLPAGAGEPGRAVYEALLAVAAADAGHGRFVHPGRARTSPLAWHAAGKNLARPWDGEAIQAQARLIPAATAQPLTNAELRTILRWIDLGAFWDTSALTPAPPRSR